MTDTDTDTVVGGQKEETVRDTDVERRGPWAVTVTVTVTESDTDTDTDTDTDDRDRLRDRDP